jgi:hypothetical protein
MVVPIIGPDIAAVVAGLLVATGAAGVIGTLIVPRSVANWLTRWMDLIVNGAFRLAIRHVADYRRRDWVLAAQAGGVRHMIAALDLATGQMTYRIRARKRWREFLAFLKLLRARWPGQKL